MKSDKIIVTEGPLKVSKVGIWLDSYDNFFSDFDPRIYSQRVISQDFLSQTKSITMDFKKGPIEITFLIPEKKRNKTTEKIIKERLRKHFKSETENIKKQKTGYLKKGFLSFFVGITLMFVSSLIIFTGEETYLNTLLTVVFDPAGWFSAWYGLDMIFYTAQAENKDLEFYKKMSKVRIEFYSYD